MTQQRGVNAEVLLGFESTFGTVATAGFIMPINSNNVRASQALNTAATLTGTRNPVAPFAGNKDVRGQIVIPTDSIAMWYWLKAMFGAPTTTGTGPYVHEFKVGSSMPPISLETAFEDLAVNKYQRFVGCKVGAFSITIGGDGELTCTLDIVGADGSLEASAFDASPTSVSLGRVENFQAAITEGGSSLSNGTEVTVNVNYGLDENQFVIGGGGVRGDIPEGIVGVSGNLKTLFEDDSLLAKANAGTESSLKATVTASASSIFELEMQEVRYEVNSPAVEGPEGVLVDLNFQAYYTDGGEASVIVPRLTNSEEHA